MSKSRPVVGIIGGTGIDQDPSLLQERTLVDLAETPYGFASDQQAISGQIEGVQVYILSRHGKNHDVNPSNVNYRANLWTLVKQLNCTHILVTSACGSLKKHIQPGQIGILDQYIDRTCSYRNRSFYKVCHVGQRKPIDPTMQKFIEESCQEKNIPCHKDLTCVTIEGPRFSTLAESKLYQSWGCDIVNMTSVPEVPLATELGVFYACILLITDFDCWHEEEDHVTASLVVERMKDLGEKARKIIPGVIRRIAAHEWFDKMEQKVKEVDEAIMVA